MLKKILCDIVSKQHINWKQNIKGTLLVEDWKYFHVRSSYIHKQTQPPPPLPRSQNETMRQVDKITWTTFPIQMVSINGKLQLTLKVYFLIVIWFDFAVIYIGVHFFFVIDPNIMNFKLLACSLKASIRIIVNLSVTQTILPFNFFLFLKLYFLYCILWI